MIYKTIIATLFLLVNSCEKSANEQVAITKDIFVGPHKVDCEGVRPQKCLLIKEQENEEWGYFYDNIKGFEYEEGFIYHLKVEVKTLPNPPADASSLSYELIEVLSKEIEENTIDVADEKLINIKYQAISRGLFYEIEANSTTCTIQKDRSPKSLQKVQLPEETWKNLEKQVQKLELNKLNQIEAPSNKRLYDGAAIATLTITTSKETYTSQSFDHLQPPDEIKTLTETLLSFADSVE